MRGRTSCVRGRSSRSFKRFSTRFLTPGIPGTKTCPLIIRMGLAMRLNTVANVKYLVSAHLTRRRNAFDPPWSRSFPRGQWRCGEDFRLLEHTFFAERSDEISLLGDSGIFVHVSPAVKRLRNENVANYLNFFMADDNRYDTIRVAREEDLDEMISQTAVATARRVVLDCGARLLERPITTQTASLYLAAVRGPCVCSICIYGIVQTHLMLGRRWNPMNAQ